MTKNQLNTLKSVIVGSTYQNKSNSEGTSAGSDKMIESFCLVFRREKLAYCGGCEAAMADRLVLLLCWAA